MSHCRIVPQECFVKIMSYTELEDGYQGLKKATRPTQFYLGAVSQNFLVFTATFLSFILINTFAPMFSISMSHELNQLGALSVPTILVEDVDSPLLTTSFWVLFCLPVASPILTSFCRKFDGFPGSVILLLNFFFIFLLCGLLTLVKALTIVLTSGVLRGR